MCSYNYMLESWFCYYDEVNQLSYDFQGEVV